MIAFFRISSGFFVFLFLLFYFSCNKDTPLINKSSTITDIDGNVYSIVKIGNQEWTVENLLTTRYSDGTPVKLITNATDWSNDTIGAYCFYDYTFNKDTMTKYGALYNWYAVNTGKLAPSGWHVPDTADWNTLEQYLIKNGYMWVGATDSSEIAKSLAAKTDWALDPIPTIGSVGTDLSANNRSGFSALPTGYCNSGAFSNRSDYTFWWSTSKTDSSYAFYRYLGSEGVYFDNNVFFKNCGMAIRLVRN
jgi:uncharacterized protein (TIGR02145 family)